MYKSPIDIIYGQMETQMEGDILRAVQKYGINVDKEELIRALQYDRGQYEKGYADAMAELVRCKDCKYCDEAFEDYWCNYFRYPMERLPKPRVVKQDDFCSYGERKEE